MQTGLDRPQEARLVKPNSDRGRPRGADGGVNAATSPGYASRIQNQSNDGSGLFFDPLLSSLPRSGDDRSRPIIREVVLGEMYSARALEV